MTRTGPARGTTVAWLLIGGIAAVVDYLLLKMLAGILFLAALAYADGL
jgi:hypothetical protein